MIAGRREGGTWIWARRLGRNHWTCQTSMWTFRWTGGLQGGSKSGRQTFGFVYGWNYVDITYEMNIHSEELNICKQGREEVQHRKL